MIRNLVAHAARLYPHGPFADPSAVRTLRRGYVRARLYLGDRWILAKRVPRRDN